MFKEIDLDLDYNLLTNYIISLVKEKNPQYNTISSQISVQNRKETTDPEKQLTESTLSLAYDWDAFNPNTMEKPPLRRKEERLKQEDFVHTPILLKNTPIDVINQQLKKEFKIMRGRIMNMAHKTALTWHYDESPRLHIPIKINEGSFMVLEDQILRFKIGKVYVIDTTKMHTAVNAAFDHRIHLVYCLP